MGRLRQRPPALRSPSQKRVKSSIRAEAIGGQDEAQATLSQGRAFLNTLATWGLWLILPLGYLSLLVQGIFAHPPVPARPEETIAVVRTRGRREQ